MPVRIAVLDRDHRHRYVNPEYRKLADRPEAPIVGRTIAEVFGEKAFAAVRPWNERALAGEIVEWDGWIELRRSGRSYSRRMVVPLHDAAGAVEGYFIFTRDLSDLLQTELDLAQESAARSASDALNSKIISVATDCIVTVDEAGRVVEFNPAAEQTFGYSKADVLGQPIDRLIVPPHWRRRYAKTFARLVASGKQHGRRNEVEAMRADGSTFPAEVMFIEVSLPERRLFTAFLRDLTAAREAEAEIQRQREALQQSEKMAAFGSMLAGVAHELNNPLSIVMGNTLLLAEETEGSPLAERAERVRAAAERCGRIVRTFLAMARERKAEMRPVTVQALVDAALQLLAYSMRASGVTLEQDIAPDLPALLCDPDQMIQVLTNLLINARQVLEERPQPRRVRLMARADAEWARIEVADNGPGIPDAIRSRVFDPFFTTKPVGSGTGIGLAVSRGIMEAHGGSLSLAPPDGEGACFVVRLPLARDTPHVSDPNDVVEVPQRPITRTALVVDDEPDIGELLGEMLQKLGYRVEAKVSGEAAQAALRQRDYDVLLCDLRLPGLDGPALYDWVSEHRPHLRARTAFITADTLSASSHRFLTRAGRPILEKPFVPAELQKLLGQLLPGAQD